MSELKKAVLGGYRRKAVDARLAELLTAEVPKLV